ncbi:MAG: succinylglutamate desuccinylase/aspartoacylase family protein [Fimbriimonadaceae bacterium]|nr:succinylglutamate desuccinylase/aspartoacylase family protein [Alphaproteobacteria bacterium]
MAKRAPFVLGDAKILLGERRTIDLPVSVLSDHTPVTMSVHVVHGTRPGPTLFVSAAVHGDEVMGVEVARRLLRVPRLGALRGTLLVVPIVNAFGFLNHSRYLPDRRDLNRSFPGSETGSLAGRLAHLFMREIVERADFGIDLHSAAIHRTNMPQIRVSPSGDETMALANVFGAPVVITSSLREGSLRQTAFAKGVDVLVYEAGEALRFDELSTRVGVSGILRVMHALGMLAAKGIPKAAGKPARASSSSWLRAPAGGLLRTFKPSGEAVVPGETLGIISDPFGETEIEVKSHLSGIIVGRTNLPVVNEGDALFHIALPESTNPETAAAHLSAELKTDPLFDEDEII